ncbi:MAG: CapA family protein [Bacteroidales bacterium]
MKITIGGDFCITPQYLSKPLIDKSIDGVFKDSDINIFNLECPIVNVGEGKKIQKTGPHLKTDERVLNHLHQLSINLVTLANNHILDYGIAGLERTIRFCENNNINYVGAGSSLKQASKPYAFVKDGLKITIINFCENEWSVANSLRGGANPMDTIDNYKQITNAKQNSDFVIVIVHGGHEFNPYPSPRMVKQYRFYTEIGADAVIGHHTHCISGYEIYNNVPILYSLGNFLFTLPNKNEVWYTGLVAQLNLSKNKPIDLNIIPIQQDKKDFNLTVCDEINKKLVLGHLALLNHTIQDENKLHLEWSHFIKRQSKLINSLSPLSFIPIKYFSAFLRRMGVNKLLMNNNYLKSLTNRFRCEAHRDITIDVLQERINDNK